MLALRLTAAQTTKLWRAQSLPDVWRALARFWRVSASILVSSVGRCVFFSYTQVVCRSPTPGNPSDAESDELVEERLAHDRLAAEARHRRRRLDEGTLASANEARPRPSMMGPSLSGAIQSADRCDGKRSGLRRGGRECACVRRGGESQVQQGKGGEDADDSSGRCRLLFSLRIVVRHSRSRSPARRRPNHALGSGYAGLA